MYVLRAGGCFRFMQFLHRAASGDFREFIQIYAPLPRHGRFGAPFPTQDPDCTCSWRDLDPSRAPWQFTTRLSVMCFHWVLLVSQIFPESRVMGPFRGRPEENLLFKLYAKLQCTVISGRYSSLDMLIAGSSISP